VRDEPDVRIVQPLKAAPRLGAAKRQPARAWTSHTGAQWLLGGEPQRQRHHPDLIACEIDATRPDLTRKGDWTTYAVEVSRRPKQQESVSS
jgi:hypothetical protein